MPAYGFSPYAIPAAVTAGALLVFALGLVLLRFSRMSISLFALSLAAAGWQIACAMMMVVTDPRTAASWARAGCAALIFAGPAVYQFVSSTLMPGKRRQIIASGAWALATVLAGVTLGTSSFVGGVQRYSWGYFPALTGAGAATLALFLSACLTAAAVELFRAHRGLQGGEQRRMRLFAIALAVGAVAVVDVLPLARIPIFPFGWMALLAFIALAGHAVWRHGLVPITPSLAAAEIIGTMRDLLLVSDRDGRIRFANNAASAFLGYTSDEIIGQRLEEVLVPMDGTQAAMLQGWVRDREYMFRTRMGQPIELTLSHSPVSRDGEVTGAVIIGRDLRERKRYEWEARRAVTLLESTLDSTADGILVIGQDGRILTWNQRFADLWGIPAELLQDGEQDLIGQLVEKIVDPAAFLDTLAALHEHPEVESVHVLELKDGRRLEQYSIGRYLDESPLRVWSFRDVTARLAAEEALRDSETRYRLLFEQNAAGVLLATIDGRIVDCNATFAEMLGDREDGLSGRNISELCLRAGATEEIRARLEQTPTIRGIEIPMRRRDGQPVSVLANVSLLGQGTEALLHMTAVDITDRKRAEEQVEFQAYHDALTQLPNRRLFVERLELSLLTARRSRGNVAVLFIDLDRFKSINDTLGHSVADALLIEIAQRLKSCVRQTDTVARYGGDEFTVILPDLHQPEDAAQVAEKILERIAEPVVASGNSIEISVSIGIAVYPFDGSDIDALLRNADDAMYRAKQAGRNTYQLCTEQMKTRATERLSMQSRLRAAMTADRLVLAYQPQISLATGRVAGAEATIRWNDPDRGTIDAAEFIPLAEETRLIVPLGEWALFTACAQIRRWREAGLSPLRVSVNISSRHFLQRDLATVVRRAIDDHGIDPAQLELEIRETTAMRDVDLSIELLNLLRETGVSIAIDDFGSAYSALGSLRVLPIDAVKIDRRIVERITTAEGDSAIASAVFAVGRTLGLRVGADGVETAEHVAFLKARGCDEGQGPYFSDGVSPDDFASTVMGRSSIRTE
jgi:diguanylate cyclase (GGDEF)-like protein/PAS domain S-box-containing protein